MFASITIDWNGNRRRSSFFHTLAEALAYAERMMGVIEVEEIGKELCGLARLINRAAFASDRFQALGSSPAPFLLSV